ncbi:hypothetical protein H1R20_g6098, partial [Candolleomyces eurysporus]
MASTDATRSVPGTSLRGIPSILFGSTLRLFCLRCILVAGTVELALQIYGQEVRAAVIFGLIVLHHLLSAFGPRLIPLFTWLDLLLTLPELAYGIRLVAVFSADAADYRWWPKQKVAEVFSFWLLTIMLAALLCIKVIQVVDARGSTFFQRVDILRDRVSDGPGQERLRKLSGGAPIPWWRYPVHVLFGRKIWERKFPTTTPIVWDIIVMWRKKVGAPQTLRESITLTPLWRAPAGENSSQGPFGPECDVIEPTQDMVPEHVNVSRVEVIIFHCPPRIPILPDDASSFVPFAYKPADTRPNLLLEANFTGLMSPGQLPNTDPNVLFDSLMVYLALTNNTNDVLSTTRPTSLFAGSNLVGVADLMVRQRLKVKELSTFGLFDVSGFTIDYILGLEFLLVKQLYNTFMIADIPYIVPETRFANPRNIPIGPNVSTLQIASQLDLRDWIVIQDYRNKSTLGGIATVGGLGSFFSIVFVVCFGNSLLGIIYRTKPLTPFGIFHQLESQRAQISHSTIEKYTSLRSDLQSLKDNPGLLAFVLDTLVDLDVVIEEHPHRMSPKQRRNAKLRDVEQELSFKKQDYDSDSDQEGGRSATSQRSIRKKANGSNAESISSDCDSGDEGEGPGRLPSKGTNEPLLEDDERRPLTATSPSPLVTLKKTFPI